MSPFLQPALLKLEFKVKIALIEKEEAVNLTGFDKVISFKQDENTHINSYINTDDLHKNYDEIYTQVHLWLRGYSVSKSFFYRDVDVLAAYGKKIFDFVYNISQKIYAVKQVIKKESPTELWISKNYSKADTSRSCLAFFIADFMPSNISLKYFNPDSMQVSHVIRSGKRGAPFLKVPVNFMRRLSHLLRKPVNDNIVIYSDLNKIPSLFEHLNGENIIFLRDDLPIRLMPFLLKNGISLRLFSDFRVSKEIMANISAISNDFINRLSDSSDDLTVDGVNFTPYLKKYLTAIWRKKLISTIEKIEQMHLMFQGLGIKSLLVDEDRSEIKNLLVQVSKKYHRRSYVNSHGDPFHKISVLPLAADHMLVWGHIYRNRLERWGMEKNRAIVVGCSKYDKYLEKPVAMLRTKICDDLALDPSKKIVLIAACPFKLGRDIWRANLAWEKLKMILNTLKSFQDLQIIIKLHSGDTSGAEILNLVKGLSMDNVKVIKSYDPLTLAKAVDILIICISTFAIDGLAFQKPVVLTSTYGIEDYDELKVFYDGTTKLKLESSLRDIIDGLHENHITNWQFAVNHCLDGMGGAASKKIADILSKGSPPQAW